MGNLGMYQIMTTWSKKLGGPKQLFVGVAIVGYAAIRSTEFAVKKAIKMLANHKDKSLEYCDTAKIFTVRVTAGIDDAGHKLNKGAQFKVLEADDDAILIEVIGDDNNPYFVTEALLLFISDYSL